MADLKSTAVFPHLVLKELTVRIWIVIHAAPPSQQEELTTTTSSILAKDEEFIGHHWVISGRRTPLQQCLPCACRDKVLKN